MITKLKENVYSFEFTNFGSLVYLIKLEKENILIDTSSKENKEELISSLKELNLNSQDIKTIILTHAHFDHIENLNLFPNAKIYSNFTESINMNHTRTKIENLIPIEKLPFKKFKIHKTPGHTKEDIIILYENMLFSGDVIFNGGYIGRTDFPESNPNEMQKSLNFIKNLKFDILCPGH